MQPNGLTTLSSDFAHRVDARVRAWRVIEERRLETASSVLVFGRREGQPVVVKVIRDGADELRSGAVLAAFEGRGVVRVYDCADGALLLEQLTPGVALAADPHGGTDVEAAAILAGVIRRMEPHTPGPAVPTVQDWSDGFDQYLTSGDEQIPARLVAQAHRTYAALCASQARVRLLHGDLHHENVLFDAGRGWIAIDPKGVIGELEYEVGAALRNPYDRPPLFTCPSTIRNRLAIFARELNLDTARMVAWAFAQAVLSAIWSVEDGFRLQPDDARLTLANTLRRMAQASGSESGG